MLRRRTFLQAAVAASLIGLPLAELRRAWARAVPLPGPELAAHDEEAYWAAVREHFLLPRDAIYLNTGTLGSSPLPVLRALVEHLMTAERFEQTDPEDYPLWGYARHDDVRAPVARFINASLDETALVRNATEAMNFIANGIDLKAGDEVILTDQEHPGGRCPWLLKEKRYGIRIRYVELPKPPKSKEEILNRLNDAITPRTRAIAVSHISTVTGLVLPVKEICQLAREKNLLSAIDGAHAIGMIRLDVKDIGCDFYGTSPHKWLLAPKGTGVLYVREEQIDRLWNTIATEHWDDTSLRAARLGFFGTANLSVLTGLKAAIEFANTLGMDRIEGRIRMLNAYLRARLAAVPGAELWSASDPALVAGIACVNFPGVPYREIENGLWQRHRIRIRGGDPSRLRISTHIYTSYADLDRFVEKLGEFLKQRHAA